MVGSLIAASGLRDQVSERITKYSQFLGAAAIALSAFWFTTLTPFPGSAALLPCIGAALLILGAKGTRITSILSAWPVTLIGDYSYAIYLWHWPLIVYWSSLSPDTFNFSAKIAIIIFSVILAAVSTSA